MSQDQDFNGDIALIACFASSWTPAMVRRGHADPFGFLRPWNELPALMGSAPPTTPPSTGTGVVTFLMGSLEAVGVTARVGTDVFGLPARCRRRNSTTPSVRCARAISRRNAR
jgi:hypothetical protein